MQESTSFLLCVRNDGHEASLEKRKIYLHLEDAEASAHALVRVVDESGDDYLYPSSFFVAIVIPERAAQIFCEISA
jgi:hypothetical protein